MRIGYFFAGREPVTGRGSDVKTPRLGIFTCGNVFASMTLFSAIIPFSCSKKATTAYTWLCVIVPGRLLGLTKFVIRPDGKCR